MTATKENPDIYHIACEMLIPTMPWVVRKNGDMIFNARTRSEGEKHVQMLIDNERKQSVILS